MREFLRLHNVEDHFQRREHDRISGRYNSSRAIGCRVPQGIGLLRADKSVINPCRTLLATSCVLNVHSQSLERRRSEVKSVVPDLGFATDSSFGLNEAESREA